MHYRTLGRTGLRVSEVGFGAWAIGGPAKLGEVEIGWGEVDDAMSLRAIEAAYDAGVTFFDTSDAYGAGRSETLLGKALKPKRDRVVIATKVGNRTVDGRWVKDFSKAWIPQALDASLARLGMDYVDLYQLH
jgi:aryl-alcohol dehydrogenase-like predicted oxidoreductase